MRSKNISTAGKSHYRRPRLRIIPILLVLIMAGPATVSGNWGMEVGRANESDQDRLLKNWIAMKTARNKIDRAMALSLMSAGQKEVLGLPADASASADVLLDEIYDWWLKDVMGPARAIAANPAASCAEAHLVTSQLLRMIGSRQILGMDGTDKRDQDLVEMLPELAALTIARCRDEALDECVATGRILQIFQQMTAEGRHAQLQGKIADVESWAEDALQQCAIYELHFVSTTNVEMPIVETVRDGKVAIKWDASAGGIMEAMGRNKLGDFLNGQTKDSPFFVSVKCALPGNFEVTCSPGADSDPVRSRIQYLDLKHKEFYVDADGISKVRDKIGEAKFAFEFAGGDFALEAVIKSPYSSNKVPLPSVGPAFYIAHRKDSLGKEKGVKIENTRRGDYPVIFKFTYADENTIAGATITDSTEFQLIHKPKPKPYPARPDRKPLKPRPGE